MIQDSVNHARSLIISIKASQCTDEELDTLQSCIDVRLRNCGIWLARRALCTCSRHLASYLGFSEQRSVRLYKDSPGLHNPSRQEGYDHWEDNFNAVIPKTPTETSDFHPEQDESDPSISRQRYDPGGAEERKYSANAPRDVDNQPLLLAPPTSAAFAAKSLSTLAIAIATCESSMGAKNNTPVITVTEAVKKF